MLGVGFLVLVLVLLGFCSLEEDSEFLLGQSCILPCRFTPGDDLEIHWFKMTPTLTEVNSFCYNDKDQWGHLDQKFGGRTSLFKDQISKGNASLQLTGVMVQDEGRYQCHTSTVTNKNTSLLTVRIVCGKRDNNLFLTEIQQILWTAAIQRSCWFLLT
uniref:Ig-like domain-containing protein n=1 Tax=Oryzias latipes TaxID=8090 RepID=A0A3B3H546_ORYLA